MLDQLINQILSEVGVSNPLYLRNRAKEEIQNFILYFVYQNPKYQGLIFTGGTALRKLYGLDRLSEDLDFDYLDSFDINQFIVDLEKFFVSELQFKKVEFKISGNSQTLFVRFPDHDLFVRCDFSKVTSDVYGINKGSITAGKFTFLVNAYDLETMFANKIVAFLTRNFFKGKFQKLPFKGRDIYDLFWLLQLSAKSGFSLKPNMDRLKLVLKKSEKELSEDIKQKIKQVDPKFVYEDVLPLVENDTFLRDFVEIFESNIAKQIDMVL